MEITEADILDKIRSSSCPLTASEIAKSLDVSRTDVNSILYRIENSRVKKSDTTPPYWSMVPLEEQVVYCLSEYPMTAIEISEELGVPKSTVNSILYRLEGIIAYHDDEKRPNWYLKENDD